MYVFRGKHQSHEGRTTTAAETAFREAVRLDSTNAEGEGPLAGGSGESPDSRNSPEIAIGAPRVVCTA